MPHYNANHHNENFQPDPKVGIKVRLDCTVDIYTITSITELVVSSGGLAVKHPALGANGRRFEPRKRSKLFQGLISRLTTSWVADQVKW